MLRIAFLGDLMIGRGVEAALAHRPPESFWGDMLPVLRQADLVVANLECPITTATTRWPHPKMWRFRATRQALAILHAGGVTAVNLANNHIGDYCEAGLLDTLEALDSAGIGYFGAGRNAEAAGRPLRLALGERRLAFVGFSDRMPEYAAGPDKPGSRTLPPDAPPEAAGPLLAGIAGSADLVVVSAHWGPDLMLRPTPRRQRLAAALLRCGAHLVHGHSSHVVHGVETPGGRPVLYDCGNALDDYWRYPWPWTRRAFVSVLEWGAAGSRLRLHPFEQRDLTLRRLPAVPRARFLAAFTKRCRELGVQPAAEEEGLVIAVELPWPRRPAPAA